MRYTNLCLRLLATFTILAFMWACTKSEENGTSGNPSQVTGTWKGTRSGWVTVTGGCGGDSSTQAMTLALILTQNGSVVTGFATAAGMPDTFQLQNGIRFGDSLTFNVVESDASCPQQSDQFLCAITNNTMNCNNNNVHCDGDCTGVSKPVHAIKETYSLTRQ